MQSLWLPAPVVVLLRRVVNVVSTLSISHHYLQPRGQPASQPGDDAQQYSTKLWETFRSLQWPTWINSSRRISLDAKTADVTDWRDISDLPDIHDVPRKERPPDAIHSLLNSPVLYDPVRRPRYPIALCHGMRHASSDFVHANLFIGLYGFDVRGPSAFPILQQHYWSNVLSILRDRVGAEVIVTAVPRYVGSVSCYRLLTGGRV